MSAISDNLIHFLARADKDNPKNQFRTFEKIIANGLRTSHMHTKYTQGSTIFNQVVCFTDIPLRECNEHTAIYGKFGIGFKKSFVKNSGGNPARYFVDYLPAAGRAGIKMEGSEKLLGGINGESRGSLYKLICDNYDFFKKLNDTVINNNLSLYDQNGNILFTIEELTTLNNGNITIRSFDKEMGDLGVARDETKEIDLFYKEREWRLVPTTFSAATGASKLIKESVSSYFSFEKKDVNMIVVPNEEIREMVVEYFIDLRKSDDERLRQFGLNILPVVNYDDLHRW